MSAIELIVVAAIVGTLVALVVPAVMAGREAARRTACANNFRQVGLAAANYVDCFRCYPPSRVTPWTVAVAPYLEQAPLYSAYDHRFDPFSDPANTVLGGRSMASLVCPSDTLRRVLPFEWASSNVAGNIELFRPNRGPDSCSDGLSSTGLCVEVAAQKGLTQIEGPELYLGIEESVHPTGFQLLFASGAVKFMSHDTPPALMQALGTPRGGEVVP